MEKNQGYIIDSSHLYKIAYDGYLKAKEGFEIHRQNEALVSIVFAALALEAFINEIPELAKCEKQAGSTEAFLDKLIDAIDESPSNKKTTQDKFMQASKALDSPFDKGHKLYQNFADLFKLRDCLVHLKPQDRIEEGEDGEIKYFGRELTQRFRSKGIFLEDTSVESITLKLSTAKAALWACNTASAMVNSILDKLPSSFRDNNPQIDSYRFMFKAPEQ